MAGMTSIGLRHKGMALGGFRDAAMLGQRRQLAEEQMEADERTSRASAIGTGAGIGASVGGPWGAAIGAAAGWLASELF